MSHCICCDRTLLRHIYHGHIYWYCPHCRQAMPGDGGEQPPAGLSPASCLSDAPLLAALSRPATAS